VHVPDERSARSEKLARQVTDRLDVRLAHWRSLSARG
jgi:hypothetical protein